MNRRWLPIVGCGVGLVLLVGGCGKRKGEEHAVLKPSGVTAQGVADPAVVARCEAPLESIFFICDATVPGSGAPSVGFAGGLSNMLLRTTDGGQTWQNIRSGNPTGAAFEKICFRSAQHGWAVSRDRLLGTGDGGQTWQEAAKLPGNFYYFGACSVSSSRYFQMQTPGCGAAVYAASAPDAAWTKWGASLPRNDYEAVFFLDDQHGWLAGNYGIAACTTNGGATWMTTNIKDGGHLVQIQFVTPQTGWMRPLLGHEGGIWASRDGGQTWAKQNAGIKTYHNLLDMHFVNERTGYLLVDTGRNTAEILKTGDGGVTWTSARTFKAPAHAFCFVSPTEVWFAARDGTLLHCALDK